MSKQLKNKTEQSQQIKQAKNQKLESFLKRLKAIYDPEGKAKPLYISEEELNKPENTGARLLLGYDK